MSDFGISVGSFDALLRLLWLLGISKHYQELPSFEDVGKFRNRVFEALENIAE